MSVIIADNSVRHVCGSANHHRQFCAGFVGQADYFRRHIAEIKKVPDEKLI